MGLEPYFAWYYENDMSQNSFNDRPEAAQIPSDLPQGNPPSPGQTPTTPQTTIPTMQQTPPSGSLPTQRPIGQTVLPQPSVQNTLSQYRPPVKPPDDTKALTIFAIVTVIVVIVVIIASIVILFGGSDEERPVTTVTPDVSTGVSPDTPVVSPVIPVAGVHKDSVLKSADRGQSFETFFFIATTTELKAIDVLNITFYPNQQDKILVSTYDDGLFLSQDAINQWEPIPFPPQQIHSFLLDSADPDDRAFASGVVNRNGRIFRTEDQGETWRVVYAEPGDNTVVSSLTQDPRNNNIIIAGTSAGTLIRSTDGGDTWKNIGQKISGKISRFDHDSTRASFAYLLVQGGKIYHSTDGGVNWIDWEEIKSQEIKDLNDLVRQLSREKDTAGVALVREQIAALQERNKTERRPSGIVFITADPNRSGVLYAGLTRGLYRSTDYGKYWEKINIIESAERFPIMSVAVNPENSDEISFVAGNAFYRSANYGSTWAVTPLDKTRNASFVAYDPFDPTQIYVGLSAKK